MHVPVQAIDREIWRDSRASHGTRLIPEETPAKVGVSTAISSMISDGWL